MPRLTLQPASLDNMTGDCREHWRSESAQVRKKELRPQIRTQFISPQAAPVVAQLNACEKLLAVIE
jgi:hypothetical protein